MSLPITMLPDEMLEAEALPPRPMVVAAARPRLRPKASLPSRIAVIGNYLPRQCGIATFTTDLCAAISAEYGTARLLALPVNDTEQGYDYPARVRWSLAQDDVASYQEAAEFLNFNNIDMVCLQHEYGIFGGPAGSHILHLLRGLKMPVVTTLHTVLREPNPDQLVVMEEIAELSDRLIVMSQLSSQFLQEIFKVPGSKIDMVPHGVPDLPFLDPNFYKDRFGVEGKAVLLTFGLLSPNKGIENVIQAMPQILSKHKNAGLHRRRRDPPSHSPSRRGQVSSQLAGFGEGNGSGVASDLPRPLRQPRGNGRVHWRSRYLHHSVSL